MVAVVVPMLEVAMSVMSGAAISIVMVSLELLEMLPALSLAQA